MNKETLEEALVVLGEMFEVADAESMDDETVIPVWPGDVAKDFAPFKVKHVRALMRAFRTRPEEQRKDYALLMNVASRIRNSFEYNPGHSDLDNEQPIHLRVTLREWRELNYALNVLQREPQYGEEKL